MKSSKHIQDLLYEFHRGELPEDERRRVEQHLASCERCATSAKEVQELVNAVPTSSAKPSEALPEQFWNSFSYAVVNRIRSSERLERVRKISFGEYLQSVLVYQRRVFTALAVGVAVVAVLVLTRQFGVVGDPDTERVTQAQSETETPTVQARLGQYFRKSQILMVGLMNMKSENGDGLDLSIESAASRELLQEARFLSEQNIDERTKRLVTDLKKILIELANIEAMYDLPDIEILRAGIRQENLLFKLRMGEQGYDSGSQSSPNATEQQNNSSQKGESL
ncbi:MAG TPA: zf-HC2 domain-containing protein [Bacteroidota bacterium]